MMENNITLTPSKIMNNQIISYDITKEKHNIV